MKRAFLFLFSPAGHVSRLPYILAQSSLIALFFLIYATPWLYPYLDALGALDIMPMLVLIWSSVVLSMKRARDADYGPLAVLAFLTLGLYVIALVFLMAANGKKTTSGGDGAITPVFE